MKKTVNHKNENTSYWKIFLTKLAMLIPNYLIVLCIGLFLYGLIGVIHDALNPLGFYKSQHYTNGYSVIGAAIFIVSIIYLFVKTDKKYFFMFKSGIFVCLGISLLVYLIGTISYR